MSERRSSGGTSKWIQTYDGDAGLSESGRGVTGVAGGSVVAGYFRVAASDMTAWIRKYDDDGNALWTTTHEGDGGGFDNLAEVVEDASGYIFAVGWEATAAEGSNGWIVKLDPDGGEIWTASFDQAGLDDYFFGVSLDPEGNPVVVGRVEASQDVNQGVILRFDR